MNGTQQSERRARRARTSAWLGLEPLEPRTFLSVSVLHNFDPDIAGGSIPFSGLTAVGQKLYGTANQGGFADSTGFLYSLNTDGSGFSVLHEFGGTLGGEVIDGRQPRGQLAVVGDRLYGTTIIGGGAGPTPQTGVGVIWSIDLSGADYQVIHTFDDLANGWQPNGGLVSDGTMLYGTTVAGGNGGGGLIYAIEPDGDNFTVLHALDSATEGTSIFAGLTLDNGRLYGAATLGGLNDGGKGAIFALDTDGSDFQVLMTLSADGSQGRTIDTRPAVLDGRVYAVTSAITSANIYDTNALVSVNINGSDPQVERVFNLLQTGGSTFGDLLAVNGRIIGTHANGGPTSKPGLPDGGLGAVWSFDPVADKLHTLFGFRFENNAPFGSLPGGDIAFDGQRLYVTTGEDGANDSGTLIALSPDDPPLGPDMTVRFGLTEITSGSGPAIDFGATPVLGGSPTRTFVVSNTSQSTMTLGSLMLPHSPFYFTTTALPATLAPGASATVQVTLLAAIEGTYNGDILIANNSASDPTPFRIPVKGVIGNGGGGGGGGGGGDELPDLAAQVLQIAAGKSVIDAQTSVIPGDKLTATLRLSNNGPGTFNGGAVQVQLLLSSDQSADGGDVAVQTLTVKAPKLVAGQSKDLKLKLVAPRSAAAGDYYLLAHVNDAAAIAEADDSNNVAASAGTFPLVLQAGQVGSRANVKLTLVDNDGTLFSVALSKGGAAEVAFDANSNTFAIAATGTNLGSALTITGKGGDNRVHLGDVSFDNPVGKVTAKTGKLTGALSAPQGLGDLSLAEVAGGSIDIGAAVPTKSIAIAGPVTQMLLRTRGTIGKFSATQMHQSRIFAGVKQGVVGVPTSADDFENPLDTTPTIASLQVVGGFTASVLAAPRLGAITLGPVQTNNAGEPFGITTLALRSLKIDGAAKPDTDRNGSVDPFSDGDFSLLIL